MSSRCREDAVKNIVDMFVAVILINHIVDMLCLSCDDFKNFKYGCRL